MKKLIFAIIAFYSYTAAGQIKTENPGTKLEIGEARQGSRMIARLYGLTDGSDTVFVLMYRNREFDVLTDIKTIEFKAAAGTLDSLYSLFSSVVLSGDPAALTLGQTFIRITKPKGMGGAIRLGTGEGWFYLTRGQLDKLFGKVR